jgi:hypothetical protein
VTNRIRAGKSLKGLLQVFEYLVSDDLFGTLASSLQVCQQSYILLNRAEIKISGI